MKGYAYMLRSEKNSNLIDEIEQEIAGKDCTFSAFVIEAVRVALENLHENEEG